MTIIKTIPIKPNQNKYKCTVLKPLGELIIKIVDKNHNETRFFAKNIGLNSIAWVSSDKFCFVGVGIAGTLHKRTYDFEIELFGDEVLNQGFINVLEI